MAIAGINILVLYGSTASPEMEKLPSGADAPMRIKVVAGSRLQCAIMVPGAIFPLRALLAPIPTGQSRIFPEGMVILRWTVRQGGRGTQTLGRCGLEPLWSTPSCARGLPHG
jgi:hypothetical protein